MVVNVNGGELLLDVAVAAVAGVWLERIDTLRCLDLRRERDSMPSTSATLATAVRRSLQPLCCRRDGALVRHHRQLP